MKLSQCPPVIGARFIHVHNIKVDLFMRAKKETKVYRLGI